MNDEDDVEFSPTEEAALAVESLEDKARYAREAFLRRNGWTQTSSTPGCYWMWQRTLKDGRIIVAVAEFAFGMTRRCDGDL